MQPHPTKKRLRSQSCGAKNTNMLLGIIYFHKNMLHNLRPLQKIETTHGSMSKRTTIRVVAASFWRSDPWTERISPTTSARGKLFTTYYNDGNIYMQWEREEPGSSRLVLVSTWRWSIRRTRNLSDLITGASAKTSTIRVEGMKRITNWCSVILYMWGTRATSKPSNLTMEPAFKYDRNWLARLAGMKPWITEPCKQRK